MKISDEIKERIVEKTAALEKRFVEIERQLAAGGVTDDRDRYAALLREHASLGKRTAPYRRLKEVRVGLEGARELAASEDEDLAEMAREELAALGEEESELIERIAADFVSYDEEGSRNAIVEIRAGTGGDEAALFARDLFRMYSRYAENKGWKLETVSDTPSEAGGFKETVFTLSGEDVWGAMRYESGTHRVQRVPKTESQGRIHTSAATVAVLPEAEEVDVKIDPADIRMDFMRSSGPGGQSVNKLSSAVRLTHEPTGITVHIQDEKSQHKNRAKAMRILRSRIYDLQRASQHNERAAMRKQKVGSGDRSEKIRTYNFPDNRVTDHRARFTSHDLVGILDGKLDPVIEAVQHHFAEQRIVDLLGEKA